MQIELLETFLDLMETNSFNRTAERLGVTQSTVSSRVQTLESAVGSKLFERSRAGTRPTTAGNRLLDHARTLRHEWNEARRSVNSINDFDRSMRIGIQHDLGAAHLGEWMAGFRSVLPQTAFYVELDFSGQMSADLLAGELDFAVLFTPRNIPDLHYERIGETTYRMISSEADRLCDIRDERYIFANYSPVFDKIHRDIIRDLTTAPLASGQNATVCSLLDELGGTAYVLGEQSDEMVASGRFRHVADAPNIIQPVYAAMHLRRRRSHAHLRLLNSVRRMFGSEGNSDGVGAP